MASKDTDLAEAAQALFCALIDFVGTSKMDELIDENSSYVNFKKNWESNKLTKTTPIEKIYNQYVAAGRTTFKDIENFLTYGKSVKLADSWYKSSVLIAKKLIIDMITYINNNLVKDKTKIAEIRIVGSTNLQADEAL